MSLCYDRQDTARDNGHLYHRGSKRPLGNDLSGIWKVVLPILAPAIMAGGLLAFHPLFGRFRHHLFVVGPERRRFPSMSIA